MSEIKHSPAPWRVETFTSIPGSWNSSCLRMIAGEDREIFTTMESDDELGPQAVADMEFAAMAANAHDDLVEAAFEAMATLDIIAPGDHRKMKALYLLKAAIKKAGAE